MSWRAFAAAVVCTVVLAGCGDEEQPADEGGDQPTKSIAVTIEGDDVSPNAERVDVKVGQKIEFVVESDAPGSIHVHSEPEHELEYAAGTTTLPPFEIDKPGIVEVESHELEKIIVQLEVK